MSLGFGAGDVIANKNCVFLAEFGQNEMMPRFSGSKNSLSTNLIV